MRWVQQMVTLGCWRVAPAKTLKFARPLHRNALNCAYASSQPLSTASRTASARVRAPVFPIADDRWLRTVPSDRCRARAMQAGASGFVVKDAPPEQLVDAVRRVHAGLRVVDPVLAAESLSTGASPLTDRERDVLRAAADGATVAAVAARLHLSEGTVRNHLSAAIGKTTARTRAEAVRLADEHGWL